MQRIKALLDAIPDGIATFLRSRWPDGAGWHRFCWRFLAWSSVAVLLLTWQTTVVTSPEFLVSGLYHSRDSIQRTLEGMSERKRQRFLERFETIRQAVEEAERQK